MEEREARAFLERFTKEELINAILSKNDRGRTARSFCWSLYIDKWDELEKAARAIGMC